MNPTRILIKGPCPFGLSEILSVNRIDPTKAYLDDQVWL